jgi:hypothetical protein
MAHLIDIPNRELQPLIRILSDAGFDSDLAALLRKPGNAEKAVELIKKQFQLEETNAVTAPPAPASACLRLLSEGQKVIIPACDGKATLAKAKDVFTGYVDSDFKNWGTDRSGEATPETKVAVYELVRDATFAQFFNSLIGLNRLALTQHQIKEFVRTHWNWLRTDGYATFFLFRVEQEFFVAVVYFRSDGCLWVFARRFVDDCEWCGGFRHRVVVPQL